MITASQDVNQFFEYLLHEHRRREMPDAQQMARLMFHVLLIAILRDHQQFTVATKQKPMLTWRIRKVQELIKEHLDQQDLDIAIQLGFASSQYFSTVFRKHVGIMPTEYRKLEL